MPIYSNEGGVIYEFQSPLGEGVVQTVIIVILIALLVASFNHLSVRG